MIDKTVTKKVTGKVYWPRVYPGFMDTGFEPQFSVDVDLPDETYKELRGLGMKARRNETTGYVKFRRKNEAPKPEWGGPPSVFLKTDDGVVPFNQPIGNGSTAEITIDLYPYKAHGGGVGVRLISLTVTDLIEYEGVPQEDGGSEETSDVASEFPSKTKAKEATPDDDIPFGS